MSMPGWYPDPAGTPGQFRYWDGAQWSQQTTGNPQAGAPAPGGFDPHDDRKRGRGPLVALLVLLLVLALGGWWYFSGRRSHDAAAPEDTHTAAPTVSAWNEKSSKPSDTPTPSDPEPSNGNLVACPDKGLTTSQSSGDTLTAAGLSVNKIQGWTDDAFAMNGMYDTQSQRLSITSTWVSNLAVGAVHKSDGFTDPKMTARSLMSCIATSQYYNGYTGRKDDIFEAVTISGHPGWHMRTEVYVNNQGSIPGDTVDLVVVDTGVPDEMGVFMSAATVGDTQVQNIVDEARSTLRVG